MRNLAIIPARGGSKRIPRKNIRHFNGKPIITYSIEAALGSGLFSEVMVSTDDKEIAECALAHGAQVPFLRSSDNSNDFATLADVVSEVVGMYCSKGIVFDNVCCILPTAPFVNSLLLQQTYNQYSQGSFSSLLTASRFSFPIFRALKKTADNKIGFVWPEYANTRSQDLEETFHDAGQLYWCNAEAFISSKKIISDNCGFFLLNDWESQDIDTDADWQLAEIKYRIIKGKEAVQ